MILRDSITLKIISNLRVLMMMIYDTDFIIHDHSLIRFLEGGWIKVQCKFNVESSVGYVLYMR